MSIRLGWARFLAWAPIRVLRAHWLAASSLGCAALVVVSITWAETCGFEGCPSAAELRAFRPSEGGRVLDRNGALLGRLTPVRRINVPLDRIPKDVRAAFIAVEDRRFLAHDGVDWWSAARALWRNVSHLDVREGSSTITMQAARSGFLDDYAGERSLRRKLIELALARRMERALTKQQILELYLNVIYLGDATYGVEAASRHYFGKSVSRLSLAEAATLAALPRAPSLYEPRRHPDRALERRDLVLALMVRERLVDSARAARAMQEPLNVADDGWRPAATWSYALELTRQLVDSLVGEDARHGWREVTVWTTFDLRAQRAAEQAVRDRAYAIGRDVQGAMVAIDPRNGEVRALVGGSQVTRGGFNRALSARRQPGSAFKPFVYAAAIEAGLTPATMVDDWPVEVEENGRVWSPANFGERYGGRMTLRHALAHSANAATVRVSQTVGLARVIDLARRLGIASPLRPVPSAALGSFEVTPLELVSAYAPLANGGLRVTPAFVRAVAVGGGERWRAQPKTASRVLDPRDAFLVTSMLRSVVDEGTGTMLRELGVDGPVAGKTGTTNNGADVWFVGYTPTVVAGFWFGYDTPVPLGWGASGGQLAAPAWASFYRKGWKESSRGWTPPPGMVSRAIDDETGLLANEWCPATRREWFKAGTEPHEMCEAHEPPLVEFAEDVGRELGRAFRRMIARAHEHARDWQEDRDDSNDHDDQEN